MLRRRNGGGKVLGKIRGFSAPAEFYHIEPDFAVATPAKEKPSGLEGSELGNMDRCNGFRLHQLRKRVKLFS
jgi:hypothetical protein